MYVLITPGFVCASSVRRFGYVNRKAFKRLFESGVGAETLVLAMGRFGGYEEPDGDHGPELVEVEPEEEGVMRKTLKKWAKDLIAANKTYDERCIKVWEYLTDTRRGDGHAVGNELRHQFQRHGESSCRIREYCRTNVYGKTGEPLQVHRKADHGSLSGMCACSFCIYSILS